jgi:hypothetical protein
LPPEALMVPPVPLSSPSEELHATAVEPAKRTQDARRLSV